MSQHYSTPPITSKMMPGTAMAPPRTTRRQRERPPPPLPLDDACGSKAVYSARGPARSIWDAPKQATAMPAAANTPPTPRLAEAARGLSVRPDESLLAAAADGVIDEVAACDGVRDDDAVTEAVCDDVAACDGVRDDDAVTEAVCDDVVACDGDKEGVGACDGVHDGVMDGVGLPERVGVGDGVVEGDCVPEAVTVGVTEGVVTCDDVEVDVIEGDGVTDIDGEPDAVAESVTDGLCVCVRVADWDAVWEYDSRKIDRIKLLSESA